MSIPPAPGPYYAAPTSALLFGACVAIWSTNWIAITTQVETLAGGGRPAATAALFWRFLLAFLTLWVVERLSRRRREGRVPLVASATVGFFYYFAGIGLSYVAARSLPSSHLACLSVSVVFLAMAIRRLWLGTPIAAANLVGAAISTGGLVLFLRGGEPGGRVPLGAVAIALVAFLCVAVGAVLSERLQRRHGATSLAINRPALGFACALYLLVALARGGRLAVPLTAAFLVPLVYLGTVCSALVFVLFIALVGRVGADRAGYVSFVYPLAATYLSIALGETELRAGMVAGSLLVAAGCVSGLLPGRPTSRIARALRDRRERMLARRRRSASPCQSPS